MILVVTSKRDLTSDFIVLELQRKGLPYLRLNTEDVPKGTFHCRPGFDNAWHFDLAGVPFDLSQVKAAYFRRPGAPEPLPEVNEAERAYSVSEWHAALQSLYWAIGERWLNAPHAIALAENKIRQIALARSLGFHVPETLVGNAPAAARAFAAEGGIIGKPLRNAVVKGAHPDRVVFTSRVPIDACTDPLSIRACPMILQREIKKRYDVRATVVGDHVFAATIDSQGNPETEVDWRKTSTPDLSHAAYCLPLEVKLRCVALTRKLGLRFGALDFVLDPEGQLWFLEINPNGQWAWIETRTGHPIAAAIVEELERISNEQAIASDLAAA
jgi:glutathione synthase/RimK-type ligase-like ATP-grasp enzyme